MDKDRAPYNVTLVYEKYSREVSSLTPPKFISIGGVPLMRLTMPNGNQFGVNLNFVHRFEYNKSNEEGKTKSNGQNGEGNR